MVEMRSTKPQETTNGEPRRRSRRIQRLSAESEQGLALLNRMTWLYKRIRNLRKNLEKLNGEDWNIAIEEINEEIGQMNKSTIKRLEIDDKND